MPNDYRQLLIDAYNGERMGVALGRELAAHAADDRERAVYELFERVESVARAQLEPMVAAANVEADALSDDAAEQQGVDLAKGMARQPRAAAWTGILPEFEKFIDHLERLRDLAPTEARGACDVLVDHEVASVAMVKALIDDDLDRARAALEVFLPATA